MEHSAIEENMLLNIDKNINSDYFIDILRSNYVRYHNIQYVSDLIGELYIHHIIHKDGFGFNSYMDQISELYVQYRDRKISPKQFKMLKARLIAVVIASKLNINISDQISQSNILQIKNYFLQEYVANGYVSHSFPEAYYESIVNNGLIALTNDRTKNSHEIEEIQNMFMSKGVVTPMGGYPYYGGNGIYYEHDFTKMFWHAIDSPEWFCWFTSSDHSTAYHKDIEVSPYILRSENDCRINVEDLCRNAGLNIDETKKVLDFYHNYYNKFSSPKLNVALIPKRVVGKSDVSKVVPSNMDLLSTISYVLNDGSKQYTEHNGNVCFETISPEQFKISVIPLASRYMFAKQYLRETKEHLTDSKNNLAILENVENNKNRLVPSMISKIKEVRQYIINNAITQNYEKKVESKQSKTKKLVLSTSLGNNGNGNKGFANVLFLSLLVFIVICVLFLVIYLII